ncbi:MAG TPA: transposase [Gemmatimonadaceae bacterium]
MWSRKSTTGQNESRFATGRPFPGAPKDEEITVQRRADRLRVARSEAGTAVADVCRQLGISEATFYVWKKKFAHLGVSELRRLRQLEDENGRLKRLVADLTLDKHMLAEALRKNA